MNEKKTKKGASVYVGLSGGVDSAVSAALLLSRGYKVTGVFIKVWTPDFLPCTWREDRRDAMRICAHLDIPFVTLDLEKEYKKEVVDYMVREYKEGKTPNPDVMCNKEIKFGAFYDYARKSGADFVATGHYAQIQTTSSGDYRLLASTDDAKDQSYFIWNIKREQLPHILFPVGGMKKPKVRTLAKKYKLPNATKKDSQGLCFLGKVDMKDFLKHFIKEKKGIVLDTEGRKIGVHDGVTFLTIGQRHGFTVTNKRNSSNPLYVVKKDIQKNTITVSLQKPGIDDLVGTNSCKLININWLTDPVINKTYSIRFRYHQTPLEGTLIQVGKKWSILLKKPFINISPGQSAVVYDMDVLIGGGVIQ